MSVGVSSLNPPERKRLCIFLPMYGGHHYPMVTVFWTLEEGERIFKEFSGVSWMEAYKRSLKESVFPGEILGGPYRGTRLIVVELPPPLAASVRPAA